MTKKSKKSSNLVPRHRVSKRVALCRVVSLISTAALAAILTTSASFATLIRTVGADVSDFVAVEARLWSLFAGLRAVATQVRLRAAVVARLASASAATTTTAAAEGALLLGFGAVAREVALRATVIALTRVAASLALRLVALARDVSALATVVAVLSPIAATERPVPIPAARRAEAVPVVSTALVAVTRPPVLRVFARVGARVTSFRLFHCSRF